MSLYKDLERVGLLDLFIALVMNLAFLALIAPALWPLGRIGFALSLATGYAVFWLTLIVCRNLLGFTHRIFRVDVDSHFDAFLISNAVVSGALIAGWSAFAALSAHRFAVDLPLWKTGSLYLIAFVSSWIALGVVSGYFSGSFYRLVNLSLGVASFVVFAFWPAAARVVFGWFFALFGFHG